VAAGEPREPRNPSQSRSWWHGTALCPATEVASHARAWIQRTIKPLSPCCCLSPHPAGNSTVPAIRVLPNKFGSQGGSFRAGSSMECGALCCSGSPSSSPAWGCPTRVPRRAWTKPLSTPRHRPGVAELLPGSQHNSGDFNHLH